MTAAPDEAAAPGAGSFQSRIATYRVAAEEIKDQPFVGVGLDLRSVTKPFGVISYEYDVHALQAIQEANRPEVATAPQPPVPTKTAPALTR